MINVKMFNAETIDRLETDVNYWLDNHTSYDIINIQYQVREHSWCNYSACITYRNGS